MAISLILPRELLAAGAMVLCFGGYGRRLAQLVFDRISLAALGLFTNTAESSGGLCPGFWRLGRLGYCGWLGGELLPLALGLDLYLVVLTPRMGGGANHLDSARRPSSVCRVIARQYSARNEISPGCFLGNA